VASAAGAREAAAAPVVEAGRVSAWGQFRRNRLAVAGLAIVALLLVAAVAAPWLAPADPAKQSLIEKRAKPGGKFLLGADEFGRDILSRVIYGSRVALVVSVLSVAVALSFGLALGCLAGFLGGWTDAVVMRVTEILLAFPYLLLAIAVVSALVVRGAVLVARETEYVSAARALGATAPRVLTRHVLRNVLPTVIVYSTLFMANAILVEAALSFLGLGVQPPTPSWGLMVSTGRDLLLVAPHVATIPGLAILVAVLGFNLLGDGLRDALDPRTGR
jgi:peptide/nickel transport system permease protein